MNGTILKIHYSYLLKDPTFKTTGIFTIQINIFNISLSPFLATEVDYCLICFLWGGGEGFKSLLLREQLQRQEYFGGGGLKHFVSTLSLCFRWRQLYFLFWWLDVWVLHVSVNMAALLFTAAGCRGGSIWSMLDLSGRWTMELHGTDWFEFNPHVCSSSSWKLNLKWWRHFLVNVCL